jgi:hypothetical protein
VSTLTLKGWRGDLLDEGGIKFGYGSDCAAWTGTLVADVSTWCLDNLSAFPRIYYHQPERAWRMDFANDLDHFVFKLRWY